MMNIFIVTDNLFIYKEFRKILDTKKEVSISYFCNIESNKLFLNEINKNEIKQISIKDSTKYLIDNFQLGFSCHSKRIFPKDLVDNVLCINIHPGLNPYNRGWFPQVFSIVNGLPVGATIHIMDEDIDHGDIIVQEEVEIYSSDNSQSVYNRVQLKEIELFKENFDAILSGAFTRIKPKSDGNYNSIRDYKDLCKIDLDKKVTFREAINFCRAMTHPPYKNAYFIDDNGTKIYISIDLEAVESTMN